MKNNISMETIYVPVASPKQLRDMMFKWKKNNSDVKKAALATTLVAFFCFAFFVNANSLIGLIASLVSGVLYLLLTLLSKTSKKLIYTFGFFGMVAFSVAAVIIDDMVVKNFFMIGFFVPASVTFYFCYKALYNYKDVYLELSKRRGFPDFLFNTADMYADKIYLQTKDKKTVAEKKVEASFNPFNEDVDITDEEVMRMNSLRYEEMKTEKMDIEAGAYYKSKEVSHENTNYTHGLAIGKFNLIFPHNDIPSSSLHEKRRLMRLWNELESNIFENEILMLCFFVFGIIPRIWFGDVRSLLHFVPIVTYVAGTNLVKLRNPFGVFLTTASVLTFLIPTNAIYLTHIMCVVAVLYFFATVFPKLLLWLLNYPILKQLSKEKGFPGFKEKVDRGYIVEEQEPLVRKEKKEAIVMDIGFNEPQVYKKAKQTGSLESDYKPKKDEAWNAFNYLNEDAENTAYDDFSYMEQVQAHKLKEKPLDEKNKPNKYMGRNVNNED